MSNISKIGFSLFAAYMTSLSFGFHVSSLEMVKNNCKIDESTLTQQNFYILASALFVCPIFSGICASFLNISLSHWIWIISGANFFSAYGMTFQNFNSLLIYRLLVGFFTGISTAVVPRYIAIIMGKRRGIWVTLFQACIIFGVFLGQLATYLAKNSFIMKCILVVFAFPNAVAFFGFGFLINPENGQFLRKEKGIIELFKDVKARRSILLAIFTSFTQQSCGVRGLIVYSNTLLKEFGNPKFLTACIGLFSLVITIFSSLFIDKIGRKPLLIISALILLIAHCFFFFRLNALISLIFFHFGYSIGIGPICWLIANEIFPKQYQRAANTICTVTHWISAFLIVAFFEYFLLILEQKVFVWFIVVVLGYLLVLSLLFKETKNKNPDFQ